MREYEEVVKTISDGLQTEQASIDKYSKQLENLKNPLARQIIGHALKNEKEHAASFQKALQFFSRQNVSPGIPEAVRTTWHRLGALTRNAETKGFAAGVLSAVLGAALAPALKKSLRPLAVRAAQGFFALSESSKETINTLGDSMKNIALEARKVRDEEFAIMEMEKDEIQQALENELRNQHEVTKKEIEHLKSQLTSLRSQLEEIKSTDVEQKAPTDVDE